MSGGEVTTIKVSKEIKERLKQYGKMGMTYEDVIVELLNKVEKMKKEGCTDGDKD
jgi:antitoxin component of RelBE/YafQ-DinJ toxin-antitoxin module